MTTAQIPAHALRQQLASADLPHAPLLLDLRRGSQFRRSRIPGSQRISRARLLSAEPPDRDLILVAASDAEAHAVAEALHAEGFHRRIQHLEGGLEAWRQAGYSLEGDAEGSRSIPGRQEGVPWLSILSLATLALALQHLSPWLAAATLLLLLGPAAWAGLLRRSA